MTFLYTTPQTPRFLAGGGKASPDAPLNGRPQHLMEAAKRGRLDQMIFFSAPLTTRTPPGRPAERPAGRPLTTGIFVWCKVTLRTETIDKRNIAISSAKYFSILAQAILAQAILTPTSPAKSSLIKHVHAI